MTVADQLFRIAADLEAQGKLLHDEEFTKPLQPKRLEKRGVDHGSATIPESITTVWQNHPLVRVLAMNGG